MTHTARTYNLTVNHCQQILSTTNSLVDNTVKKGLQYKRTSITLRNATVSDSSSSFFNIHPMKHGISLDKLLSKTNRVHICGISMVLIADSIVESPRQKMLSYPRK
eukprot:scaffold27385_cov47-Attheya_sp.AAC.8